MGVLVCLLLYFLPTIVAACNRNRIAGVFLVNLFLGWTGIGWIVALVMAFCRPASNNQTVTIVQQFGDAPTIEAPRRGGVDIGGGRRLFATPVSEVDWNKGR